MNRRQLRRLQESIPQANPDGLFITDPETGIEHFLTYSDLSSLCKDMMDPANSVVLEQTFGKMHYTRDPTYNLRKRK